MTFPAPPPSDHKSAPWIDPFDRTTLIGASTAELEDEAKNRPAAALELYRYILDEREPRHPSALRIVGLANLDDDVDKANLLLRQAHSVGSLTPEDYRIWIDRLWKQRQFRQAANVAHSLQDKFEDQPDLHAYAAWTLAKANDFKAAEMGLSAVQEVPRLSDEAAAWFVETYRRLLVNHEAWKNSYADKKDVITDLIKHQQRPDADIPAHGTSREDSQDKPPPRAEARIEAAFIALDHDDVEWADDLTTKLIEFITNGRSAQLPVSADELARLHLVRAAVAGINEDYNGVLDALDLLEPSLWQSTPPEDRITDKDAEFDPVEYRKLLDLYEYTRLERVTALYELGRLGEALELCTTSYHVLSTIDRRLSWFRNPDKPSLFKSAGNEAQLFTVRREFQPNNSESKHGVDKSSSGAIDSSMWHGHGHPVPRFVFNSSEIRRRDLLNTCRIHQMNIHYHLGNFLDYWETLAAIKEVDFETLSETKPFVWLCQRVWGDEPGDRALEYLREWSTDSKITERERIRRENILVAVSRISPARSTHLSADSWRAAYTALRRVWRNDLMAAEIEDRQTAATRRKMIRAAYLALLSDNAVLARTLLKRVDVTNEDWRVLTLEAVAAIAAEGDAAEELRGDDANRPVRLLHIVMRHRLHDLDLRCLLAQAHLNAGKIEDALYESGQIVAFAPGHVQARLLRAEALYRAAGSPDEQYQSSGSSDDSSERREVVIEDYDRLILAAKEYNEVLSLSARLGNFIETRQADGPIASGVLPKKILIHCARRCARASLRASRALALARLPQDESLHNYGEQAITFLNKADGKETDQQEADGSSTYRNQADRFERLLSRPGRMERRRKITTVLRYVGVVALLVLLAFLDTEQVQPAAARFGPESSVRLAIVVAIVGLLLWPYISKFAVGPVAVERIASTGAAPSAPIPIEDSIGAQELIRQALIDPTAPRELHVFEPPVETGRSKKPTEAEKSADELLQGGEKHGHPRQSAVSSVRGASELEQSES